MTGCYTAQQTNGKEHDAFCGGGCGGSKPSYIGQATMGDQFAMAALTGLLSNVNYTNLKRTGLQVAEECYEMADAMMEARKPKESA